MASWRSLPASSEAYRFRQRRRQSYLLNIHHSILEARIVTQFNYSAPAELFPGKNKLRQLRYRRFSSAAEAVRYVIEDLPKDQVNASTLEVNEQRFNGAQIRELYNASAFPLDRAIAA
jgi:hypothetical protein